MARPLTSRPPCTIQDLPLSILEHKVRTHPVAEVWLAVGRSLVAAADLLLPQQAFQAFLARLDIMCQSARLVGYCGIPQQHIFNGYCYHGVTEVRQADDLFCAAMTVARCLMVCCVVLCRRTSCTIPRCTWCWKVSR